MAAATKHLLQEALIWVAVVLGGFALFYFFDDLKAALLPAREAPRSSQKASPRSRRVALPAKCDSRQMPEAISCSTPT
jgi:hypothetical protein